MPAGVMSRAGAGAACASAPAPRGSPRPRRAGEWYRAARSSRSRRRGCWPGSPRRCRRRPGRRREPGGRGTCIPCAGRACPVSERGDSRLTKASCGRLQKRPDLGEDRLAPVLVHEVARPRGRRARRRSPPPSAREREPRSWWSWRWWSVVEVVVVGVVVEVAPCSEVAVAGSATVAVGGGLVGAVRFVVSGPAAADRRARPPEPLRTGSALGASAIVAARRARPRPPRARPPAIANLRSCRRALRRCVRGAPCL